MNMAVMSSDVVPNYLCIMCEIGFFLFFNTPKNEGFIKNIKKFS